MIGGHFCFWHIFDNYILHRWCHSLCFGMHVQNCFVGGLHILWCITSYVYITKCEALLQDNSVYQHLSKDTSPTIHKELIKILQDYKNNNFISETEYTQLRPHGSISPATRFYGLCKILKNNMPMHPIVSACGTATYNTAKFITKILQYYCGKTSSFVKDSADFIKKIKHLNKSRRRNFSLIWCQCSLYWHSSTCCTTSYQFQNFYLYQFHQCLQNPYRKIHEASGIHFNQLHLLL